MSLAMHDPEIGLKYVANNKALYNKVLAKFVDQQSGAAVEVQAALAQGDLETAHRLVHTLKGLAGSMGMPQLQETATNIDAAFKAGLDISPMIPQLAVELDAAMQAAGLYLATIG